MLYLSGELKELTCRGEKDLILHQILPSADVCTAAGGTASRWALRVHRGWQDIIQRPSTRCAGSSRTKDLGRGRKGGTLRSGRGGKGGKVTSRKQAIAIGLSEARKKGARVPEKKAAM